MMRLAALCILLDAANEHMPWALPLIVQAILGGLTITAGSCWRGLCSRSGWGWISGTTPVGGAIKTNIIAAIRAAL